MAVFLLQRELASLSGGGASAAATGAVSLKAGGGFDSVGTEATGVAGVGGAVVQLLDRCTKENQLGRVRSCRFDNALSASSNALPETLKTLTPSTN